MCPESFEKSSKSDNVPTSRCGGNIATPLKNNHELKIGLIIHTLRD